MNIKISKEQHERLCCSDYKEHLFGSRLFGTHTEESDYDYIRVYNFNSIFPEHSHQYLPNIHSFQYDDKENNTQYIWMTTEQFMHNLHSGDGTMQSDIILFGDNKQDLYKDIRTYKIIKAYLGVSKRDLKQKDNKKKSFHAERSLYIASKLIENKKPLVEDIQHIAKNGLHHSILMEMEKDLRQKAHKLFQENKIQLYNIAQEEDELLNIMLNANNQTEFRYD